MVGTESFLDRLDNLTPNQLDVNEAASASSVGISLHRKPFWTAQGMSV